MIVKEQTFFKPKKPTRVLTILESIDNNPRVSQASLATKVGISAAMANSYIKDMLGRGLIQMTGNNRRKIQYFLTPEGRKLLSEMLRSYSTEVIQLYGAAKKSIEEKLKRFLREGISRVALFGAAETCEVVLAAAEKLPLAVVAVVDNDKSKHHKCLGAMSISPPEALDSIEFDAVIITSFAQQDAILKDVSHLAKRGVKIKTL
ncbi:MAG: winged helix-turn-helix transcriptional regulator [Planctomycetota bacterium]